MRKRIVLSFSFQFLDLLDMRGIIPLFKMHLMKYFCPDFLSHDYKWMLLIGTQIIMKNSNVTENNYFFGAAPRGERGNLSFYK